MSNLIEQTRNFLEGELVDNDQFTKALLKNIEDNNKQEINQNPFSQYANKIVDIKCDEKGDEVAYIISLKGKMKEIARFNKVIDAIKCCLNNKMVMNPESTYGFYNKAVLILSQQEVYDRAIENIKKSFENEVYHLEFIAEHITGISSELFDYINYLSPYYIKETEEDIPKKVSLMNYEQKIERIIQLIQKTSKQELYKVASIPKVFYEKLLSFVEQPNSTEKEKDFNAQELYRILINFEDKKAEIFEDILESDSLLKYLDFIKDKNILNEYKEVFQKGKKIENYSRIYEDYGDKHHVIFYT